MSDTLSIWEEDEIYIHAIRKEHGEVLFIEGDKTDEINTWQIEVPSEAIPALVRFLVPEIDALREVAEAADWLYAHSTIETAEEPRLRLEAALAKLRAAERKERT